MVDLNFSVLGSKKPPVILLHGLFGMGDNLLALAKVLEKNYTVYRLDLRNHGRSSSEKTMSLPEMADDVRAWMDEQGIERMNFVGHSLGGKVAMQLALTWPERVNKLVVADIAPVEYPPHHSDVLEGLQKVELSTLSSRRDADQVLSRFIEESGVRQFLLKSLYKNDQGFHWRFNLDVIVTAYDHLRQGVSGESFLNPVLFIKGENSKYIRAENQSVIKQLFPNFDFKVIQDTGHWLHAEKPAVFNRLVERFLLGG